jgi:hypothetical protein
MPLPSFQHIQAHIIALSHHALLSGDQFVTHRVDFVENSLGALKTLSVYIAVLRQTGTTVTSCYRSAIADINLTPGSEDVHHILVG